MKSLSGSKGSEVNPYPIVSSRRYVLVASVTVQIMISALLAVVSFSGRTQPSPLYKGKTLDSWFY